MLRPPRRAAQTRVSWSACRPGSRRRPCGSGWRRAAPPARPTNSRKSRTASEAQVPRRTRRPALRMRAATCTPWPLDDHEALPRAVCRTSASKSASWCRIGVSGADHDRCEEAVDEPANGPTLTTTATKQRRGIIVVRGCRRNHHRTREQAAQPFQMVMVARTGKHFHPHRMASRHVGVKQGLDPIADRRSGYRAETRPTRRYRSESPEAAGTQLVEIALPTGAAQAAAPPRR